MRPTSRLRGLLVLPALLGLSACATYNPAYGGLPFPFPNDDGRYDRRGDYGDYGRTNEWRRVDSDANRYANEVDRAIGLGSSEERAVARVVRDRARDLLQRTHPSEHSYVYPFPRNDYEGHTRSWWSSTDRAIERVLSSSNRRDYRAWVNGDYYGGYSNRDGYYDRGRYDDRDYRGRRYEEARRRYDPVYNDARRAQARREALEAQRRRQAEQRREEARRREDARRRYEDRRVSERRRNDDARRESERRRQEIERRQQRENELRRRQEAERRQDDARRDRDARRRQETRSDDRRPERGAERPRRQSERGNDSRRRSDRRNDDARDNDRAQDDNDERERSADRGRGRGARPQRGS